MPVTIAAIDTIQPDVDGAVEMPDRPGLGADPDEDMIAKFRV